MRWGTLPLSRGIGGKGAGLAGDRCGFWKRHLLPGGGVGTAHSNPCSEAGWHDSGHRVPGSKGDRLFLGSVCVAICRWPGALWKQISPLPFNSTLNSLMWREEHMEESHLSKFTNSLSAADRKQGRAGRVGSYPKGDKTFSVPDTLHPGGWVRHHQLPRPGLVSDSRPSVFLGIVA